MQGFDIDNDYNVYVSCQPKPDDNGQQGLPRMIVKIPWNDNNSANWYKADYSDYNSTLDINNHVTEFEGIQVIDDNSLYLTVAYHNTLQDLKTDINKIFKIEGFRIH